MKVAILGCGPAGLLAAYAAELHGHAPIVFSRKVKSVMPGAQYIHAAIPGLTYNEVAIKYAKLGTREGYAQKVYGSPDAPCSWDAFPEGVVPGYDMVAAYDALWDRYKPIVLDGLVDHELLAMVQQKYDMVFSAVPAPLLCYGDCFFRSQTIWVAKTHRDICEQLGDPCIIYNGQESDLYYRTSLLNGVGATEYSDASLNVVRRGELVPPLVRAQKPLDNNCRCRPNIIRIGRFGQWKKGVLVHDAFKEACDALH